MILKKIGYGSGTAKNYRVGSGIGYPSVTAPGRVPLVLHTAKIYPQYAVGSSRRVCRVSPRGLYRIYTPGIVNRRKQVAADLLRDPGGMFTLGSSGKSVDVDACAHNMESFANIHPLKS